MGTPREALFRNTCVGWFLNLEDWTENCILIHYMLGRQMELVGDETEIFGVEYWADYNDEDEPIPFRQRVFPSSLDGKHITGKILVLLGVEDRRAVRDWILRDANVKRWPSLYATEPINEVDKKTYSIFEFTWAFKTWILEVSRAGPNDYYTRHRRYPRVASWSSNKKFYRHMLRDFLHGRVPAERLIPDEIEAGLRWWVSSKAYFDGRGGPSSFQTPANNSFFNMGTPTNWQTPMSSQPGSSNWQCDTRGLGSNHHESPYTHLPPTTVLPKKRVDKTKKKCKNDNVSPLNLGNAFAYDNVGGDDVVITGVHDTGIYFTYENVDPNKVTREEYNDFTEFILNPYDVYLDCYMMGYLVPNFFWRQLVPHLCMPRSHSVDNPYQEGWLSGDQMNAWIEILIRSRPQNADWTVSKSGTTCVHPENNRFMIQTDPHIIGTLDGSTRPYPSWKYVNWVYMPINVGGNHWVTGAVNLPNSIFYVFDSMESQRTRLLLEHQIKAWTPVINGILQMRGYFHGSERQPHNFILSYNQVPRDSESY
ncbi:phospholipase-like protein [Tanacetum coccineum]